MRSKTCNIKFQRKAADRQKKNIIFILCSQKEKYSANHGISFIRYLCRTRIQNEHCYSLKLTNIKTKL